VNPTIDNEISGITPDGDARFTAIETYVSRQASLQQGREQRSREFLIYSEADPPVPIPDAQTAASLTGVNYGDSHPENSVLRAVDVDVEVSDSAGRAAYMVTWNYRAVAFRAGVAIPENPEAPDFQELNLTTDPTLIDTWRVGPFDDEVLPPNGNIPASWGHSQIDIGGIPNDSGGIPNSYLVRRGTFEITRNLPFAEFDSRPLLESGGARNSVQFVGFPIGSLLYLGARSTRVSQGVIRVTHEFGFDEFYHLQQLPKADVEGNTSLSVPAPEGYRPGDPIPSPLPDPSPSFFKTREPDGTVVFNIYPGTHAYPVYWFQPFPRLLDFSTLDIIVPGFFPP